MRILWNHLNAVGFEKMYMIWKISYLISHAQKTPLEDCSILVLAKAAGLFIYFLVCILNECQKRAEAVSVLDASFGVCLHSMALDWELDHHTS